jgi:hypothetical protein
MYNNNISMIEKPAVVETFFENAVAEQYCKNPCFVVIFLKPPKI